MAGILDLPDELLRLLISYGDIFTLLSLGQTARCFVEEVRTAPQWELAFNLLNKSNTFNLFVKEEPDRLASISNHLLSDPRLCDDFDHLSHYQRFQKLAPFCRASVEHFRELHDIWGEGNWTFLYNDIKPGTTPLELHINKLQDLEVRAGANVFSRYGVMANLIKLNLAQSELVNVSGPRYWYDRLGDTDCDPFTGSSYRDSLSVYFIDAFVEDDDGHMKPALIGVEVGSNTHLTHLASLEGLPVYLFGEEILCHFEILRAAFKCLPDIIAQLEEQEREEEEEDGD